MGANSDTAGLGQIHGVLHPYRVSGVIAAGHVRRGNVLYDLLVEAHLPCAVALSHVAVEVDFLWP